MGKATDTRARMIQGAKELIRKRGYAATSFKDIWEYTNTPRGSVYFHFPGGKEELADKHVPAAEAAQVARLTVSGLEGARIVAKTVRERRPLEEMGTAIARLVTVAA
jgi:TetR/AcrR family transcriptional repressor of lmrAB and yxaGH operons